MNQAGIAGLTGSLARTGGSLRQYWSSTSWPQRFAYIVALALMVSGAAHGALMLVLNDPWQGDVSFRKPATFGISFGMTLATLAWFLDFLVHRRWLVWATMLPLSLCVLFEVFAVTLQRWRGVPSHFNISTSFDSAIFSLMGIAIAIVGLVIVAITVWSFFPMKAEPGMTWAIRTGLLLLIAAQVLGAKIIGHGLALLDQGSTGPFNIFGTAGVLKLPHFAAMHAIQVLPLIALLLGTAGWQRRQVVRVVLVAAAGYGALVVYTVLQAYSGAAPLAMTAASAVVFVLGSVLLVGTVLLALVAAWRYRADQTIPTERIVTS